MTQAQISYSDLVAALAIDGAIAMIAGTVQGKSPVESVALSPEQRRQLDLGPQGTTLFFPAGGINEDGVFFDLDGDKATIWYSGGDCEDGLRVFELALKKAYPKTKYLGESQNQEPTMLSRVYEVALSEGKFAVVEVSFPGRPGGRRQFAVRVFAKQASK